MTVPDLPVPIDGAPPVQFDVAAARTAIAALDDLRASVETLVRIETGAADGALVEWTGSAAAWFAERRAELAQEGGELVGRIDELVWSIAANAGAAVEEQNRRNESAMAAAAAAAEEGAA